MGALTSSWSLNRGAILRAHRNGRYFLSMATRHCFFFFVVTDERIAKDYRVWVLLSRDARNTLIFAQIGLRSPAKQPWRMARFHETPTPPRPA